MPIAKKEGSFLDGLLSSGLITEAQLVETFGPALPDDPSQLVAELIKANLLTPYQAKQLLAGKFRGFIIGPYRILRPLGQGGMGTVFLANHTTLNRKVALKILSPQHAKDRLNLERFQREARTAASLDHPNIVKLFDISQGAGVHFLVMEFVEGKNLQAFLADTGPLHFAQAVQYIAQAASGLQHAHDKGLIHRDIKPSNLMLGKDGTIKILDLGLTRSFTDQSDDLTGTLAEGQVAGTVDFLSPEQAMNQHLDERSDLYSLGATFYVLITGQPPFKGSTTQKLLQHQMKEPPSVTSRLRGHVPEALSDVIRKMMAKKPGDRYATASDVIDALSPWLPAATTGNIVHDPLTASQFSQVSKRGISTLIDGARGEEAKPVWKQLPVLIGAGIGLATLVTWLLLSAFIGDEAKQLPQVVLPPGTDRPADPQQGGRAEPKQIPAPKPRYKAENPPMEGRFQPLALAEAATIHNTGPLFTGLAHDRFVFDRPGVNQINDVPFLLPDAADTWDNIIALNRGGRVAELRSLPRTARLKIDAAVERLHFLSGVSGWGWRPNFVGQTTPLGTVCMVTRLHYKDGSTEDHPWKNGEHFADFFIWKTPNGSERIDVPDSSFAIETKNDAQVRYLTIRPASPEKVLESVEFIKGEDDELTSPVVIAVTVEKP
jgi:serine/threonine protein kinase